MALTIIGRAGWGAKPPESRTPWDVSKLEGICLHWFGVPKASSDHAGCDDLLRSVQRSHQAGEFSDIAYNHGVCPHGSVYELRGWNTQTGANGNQDLNTRFYAIVYMAGVGDGLTPKGRAALIELFETAFRKGVGIKAVAHGAVAPSGTECPGPALRNFLASGAWKPAAPQRKVRYILMDGDGKQMGSPSTSVVADKTEIGKLTAWLQRRAPNMLTELRSDGDVGIRREKV
jgi:N-acetylmuramoyl-L-alanine amidase-like protein